MLCKTASGVQEIEYTWHYATTNEHGYGTKNPEEEREWHVECSQPKGPKEASSIQVSCNILNRLFIVFPRRHSGQEANMSIVSYRLYIEKESNKEAQQDRKVLDWRDDGSLIAVN